jgi:SAM-dependent methyltransferase
VVAALREHTEPPPRESSRRPRNGTPIRRRCRSGEWVYDSSNAKGWTTNEPIPDEAARIGNDRAARSRRDEVLRREILDALASDRRVPSLPDLDVHVREAVVHLSGLVPSTASRRVVAETCRRIAGIRAVWDVVGTPERPAPLVLDLGVGEAGQVEAGIGIDVNEAVRPDVVADVGVALPFADGVADHVFAVHVLEHVADAHRTMREIHRILRPDDGVLHVLVPFWRHEVAVADPSHVRYFVPRTFLAFCASAPGADRRFRPLCISRTDDTVFADLAPLPVGASACEDDLARWFDA